MVPEKLTDDSLARIVSQFQSSRLPVVTWRHAENEAVLLRSASFVVTSSVHRKKPSMHLSKNSQSEKAIEMGILSSDVEALITTIVNACPMMEEHGLTSSFTQEMSLPPASLMFAPDDGYMMMSQSSITSLEGNKSSPQDIIDGDSPSAKYHYSLYAAADGGYDWEPSGAPEYFRKGSLEDQPMTISSGINPQEEWEDQPLSMVPMTSLIPNTNTENSSPYSSPKMSRRLSFSSRPLSRRMARDVGEVFGRGISKKNKQDNSEVNFASLPTAPRDWVVMDALQNELENWQTNGLYIIGEKRILSNVPTDVYTGCTLLPVEVRPHPLNLPIIVLWPYSCILIVIATLLIIIIIIAVYFVVIVYCEGTSFSRD